jgi:UDP-2,3-diacylglucosamine pyrophosphatase LpxH
MNFVAELAKRTAQPQKQSLDRLQRKPLQLRSLFISDVHLGFPGCHAEFLCDFLDQVNCEFLYLVGDIVDFQYMRKRRFWPESHSDVVQKILEMARAGTRVVYVPGNHDDSMRRFCGLAFGHIEVMAESMHESADGRRFLVIHGDQFDSAIRCSPLLSVIGTWTYDGLLRSNAWVNAVRRWLGRDYWSLVAFLKHRNKNAVRYVARFEDAALRAASKERVDAVICGHIHRAEISTRETITYMNCGDWVESCTALLEHRDGRMELVQWREKSTSLKETYVAQFESHIEDWAA